MAKMFFGGLNRTNVTRRLSKCRVVYLLL